jgi:hypothetical protein
VAYTTRKNGWKIFRERELNLEVREWPSSKISGRKLQHPLDQNSMQMDKELAVQSFTASCTALLLLLQINFEL